MVLRAALVDLNAAPKQRALAAPGTSPAQSAPEHDSNSPPIQIRHVGGCERLLSAVDSFNRRSARSYRSCVQPPSSTLPPPLRTLRPAPLRGLRQHGAVRR